MTLSDFKCSTPGTILVTLYPLKSTSVYRDPLVRVGPSDRSDLVFNFYSETEVLSLHLRFRPPSRRTLFVSMIPVTVTPRKVKSKLSLKGRLLVFKGHSVTHLRRIRKRFQVPGLSILSPENRGRDCNGCPRCPLSFTFCTIIVVVHQ